MIKVMKHRVLAIALILISAISASAQDWAVKTNLLYDATLTINAGVEHRLAPRWSVDVSGNFNAWTVNEHRWKHWLVQPEARYWFCEAIQGHFVGAHLLGGQYNVDNLDLNFKMLGTDFRNLRDHRYQGWYGGVGWPTATRGSSTATGTSRPKSASAGSIPATTCSPAPTAAPRSPRSTPTTMSAPPRRLSTSCMYSNRSNHSTLTHR